MAREIIALVTNYLMALTVASRMTPQHQLHNMVLDFLYRQICLGKTNQEIFREMESKTLPTMNNDELEAVRLRFKDKESENPAKMAEFRAKLGIR